MWAISGVVENYFQKVTSVQTVDNVNNVQGPKRNVGYQNYSH